MIDFSAYIKPYTKLNECGDFYQFLELKDYNLLVVGDIGGHGSTRVYQISVVIQEVIENNKEKPIIDLIKILHTQEILQNNGMTIFIAQVYKNMPIINYSAIGNTKAMFIRKNNILPLVIQEGILGYDIPTTIKLHMTKILDNDLLIVTTDGISFHKDDLILKVSKSKNLDTLTKDIVETFGNNDDRICATIAFTVDNHKYFSIQHVEYEENPKVVEPLKNNPIKKHQTQNKPFKKKELIFEPSPISDKKIILFQEERLLLNNLKQSSLDFIISKIVSIAYIERMLEVKIKTFLHEVLKYSSVDLYLDKSFLQIHIQNISKLKESLEFLFDTFYINKDGSCIIQFFLPQIHNLNDEQFHALKEMLELQLDDEEYEKFKENEKNIQKIASQSRLSAMGEMIGNIAHQWRQPLSVISTSASGLALQKEYDMLSDEKFYAACELINENAQYLSTTIDDFRDFIKGETKEEHFSITTLIEKTNNIVGASIKDNYISLIENHDNTIELDGAINLLIQVLVNIINNAKDILVEKEIENKYIFLNIETKNNHTIISILDNGGGIPLEIKDKIFDAYFTTKHQSKGTGLGLNMAYNIISNSFKGTIEVENKTFEYENHIYKGANFIITIPIVSN